MQGVDLGGDWQICSLNILNACAESCDQVGTMRELEQGHLPKASIRSPGTGASGRRYASRTDRLLANRNMPNMVSCRLRRIANKLWYRQIQGRAAGPSRDLSQAIYEYAPDANSRRRSLVAYIGCRAASAEYYYHVCKRCGGFRYGIESADEDASTAEVAGLRRRLDSEFGFVAAPEPESGPRPPRRMSGDVHVLSQPPEVRSYRKQLRGGSVVVSAGRAGSSPWPMGRTRWGSGFATGAGTARKGSRAHRSHRSTIIC